MTSTMMMHLWANQTMNTYQRDETRSSVSMERGLSPRKDLILGIICSALIQEHFRQLGRKLYLQPTILRRLIPLLPTSISLQFSGIS